MHYGKREINNNNTLDEFALQRFYSQPLSTPVLNPIMVLCKF